jgi:hypothetical protein
MQLKSSFGWSLSNLVALLRQQLFVYRDLWVWIDNPFQATADTGNTARAISAAACQVGQRFGQQQPSHTSRIGQLMRFLKAANLDSIKSPATVGNGQPALRTGLKGALCTVFSRLPSRILS